MFGGKSQETVNSEISSVGVLSDRSTVDQFRLKKQQRLVHYLADLPFNRSNPHKIRANRLSGVEDFSEHPSDSDVVVATPASYLLSHPDKDSSNITLYDWLKLKLSKHDWEHDHNYRDTIIRCLIALLLEGDPQKVGLVNQFIRDIGPYQKKEGHVNPTLTDGQNELHFQTIRSIFYGLLGGFDKEFDDFTTCMWTRLYYLSERYPEKISLDKETKAHILNRLLKIEGTSYDDAIAKTGEPIRSFASLAGFPVTKKGILNSENHLLMINGSAYLKNQLINPSMNRGSALEKGLCDHLDDMYYRGLTEFNSIPYAGYTLDALFNLHDFSSEPVKSRATRVLDKIFLTPALCADCGV